MLCEKCKQREATVHKQAIVNGVSHSEHLCSECAAKEGKGWMNDFDPFFNNDLFSDHAMSDWFKPFFQSVGSTAAPKKQLNQIGACPHCGMSWEDFQRNGLLGCSECYNHFADVLPPLLRRLHGQSEHIGKKPYGNTVEEKPQTSQTAPQAEMAPSSELEKLQQAMREAIDTENFEEAARLRDEIKALKAKEE